MEIGKVVSWRACKCGMCPQKHPKVCVPFLYPSYTLQPRKTPSSVKSSHWGCCIPGGQLKKGGWNWEPQQQEMWRPGSFSKLFHSRGCTALQVPYTWSRCRQTQLDLDFVLPSGGGPGTPCPRGNSFSGTCSPGLLTLGQSSLGNEACMGSSLWPDQVHKAWVKYSELFFLL